MTAAPSNDDPRDLFDLTGRTAVVTGAGGGLARASSLILAAAGATVCCADIDGSSAEATAAAIAGADGSAYAAVVDVTRREGVEELLDDAMRRTGRVDVMCNIAGIPGDGALVADLEEAAFDRVFGVHFKGVLFGCQAAARVMGPRGRGSIVNMSSTAIDTPRRGLGSYTVAKAAVAELTKVLAVELGPLGIRVNAVAPGFIPTALSLASFRPDRDDAAAVHAANLRRDEMLAEMAAMSPLGRMGEAGDIAKLLLFLASDASAFFTGQTLRPNGGASMPW